MTPRRRRSLDSRWCGACPRRLRRGVAQISRGGLLSILHCGQAGSTVRSPSRLPASSRINKALLALLLANFPPGRAGWTAWLSTPAHESGHPPRPHTPDVGDGNHLPGGGWILCRRWAEVLAAAAAVAASAVSPVAHADAPSITRSWAGDDRTVQPRVYSTAMQQDIMVNVLRPADRSTPRSTPRRRDRRVGCGRAGRRDRARLSTHPCFSSERPRGRPGTRRIK